MKTNTHTQTLTPEQTRAHLRARTREEADILENMSHNNGYLSLDDFQNKLETEVIPEMTVLLAEEIKTYNQKRVKEYA